jgi:hypothetical protein
MNALSHYQVVTLAVYSYFITSVMGRQWVEGVDEVLQKHRNTIDLYFPIFTTLQVSIFLHTQEAKRVLDFRCRDHSKSFCVDVEALTLSLLN